MEPAGLVAQNLDQAGSERHGPRGSCPRAASFVARRLQAPAVRPGRCSITVRNCATSSRGGGRGPRPRGRAPGPSASAFPGRLARASSTIPTRAASGRSRVARCADGPHREQRRPDVAARPAPGGSACRRCWSRLDGDRLVQRRDRLQQAAGDTSVRARRPPPRQDAAGHALVDFLELVAVDLHVIGRRGHSRLAPAQYLFKHHHQHHEHRKCPLSAIQNPMTRLSSFLCPASHISAERARENRASRAAGPETFWALRRPFCAWTVAPEYPFRRVVLPHIRQAVQRSRVMRRYFRLPPSPARPPPPPRVGTRVAQPHAEGAVRCHHRGRRWSRSCDRLLPRQDHGIRNVAVIEKRVAGWWQHRAQHHDHPLELPSGPVGGDLRKNPGRFTKHSART